MSGDMYIVCRTCKVTLAFVAMAGLPASEVRKTLWDSPILDENAKVFSTRKDAVEYCERMNDELHNPRMSEDGRFVINAAPYDDYNIIEIAKGARR